MFSIPVVAPASTNVGAHFRDDRVRERRRDRLDRIGGKVATISASVALRDQRVDGAVLQHH